MSRVGIALLTVAFLVSWSKGSAEEGSTDVAGAVGSSSTRQEAVITSTEQGTDLEKGKEKKHKRNERGDKDDDNDKYQGDDNGKGKKKGKHQHRGKGHLHQRGLDQADEMAGEHGSHGRDKAKSHRKRERE